MPRGRASLPRRPCGRPARAGSGAGLGASLRRHGHGARRERAPAVARRRRERSAPCLRRRPARDVDAVLAALCCPWSNGQVEGQVHRITLVRRSMCSMYGRASRSSARACCTRRERSHLRTGTAPPVISESCADSTPGVARRRAQRQHDPKPLGYAHRRPGTHAATGGRRAGVRRGRVDRAPAGCRHARAARTRFRRRRRPHRGEADGATRPTRRQGRPSFIRHSGCVQDGGSDSSRSFDSA